MLPQNKFLKLVNDVLTSRYFSLILSLISLSVGIGLFVNKAIGLIAFGIMVIFSLLFIFLLLIVTHKSATGYIIVDIDHKWEMNDSSGQAGKGKRAFDIELTRPLNSIRETLMSFEKITQYQGENVLSVYEEMDGSQKIAIVNFDAQYPRKTQLRFQLDLVRQIDLCNSNYLELPIRCETRHAKATINLPFPKEKGSDSKPQTHLFQRKLGTTVRLPTNQKNVLGKKIHSLQEENIGSWLIQWESNYLDIETDYMIRWNWILSR